MSDWPRSDLIAIAALFVAVITCLAAIIAHPKRAIRYGLFLILTGAAIWITRELWLQKSPNLALSTGPTLTPAPEPQALIECAELQVQMNYALGNYGYMKKRLKFYGIEVAEDFGFKEPDRTLVSFGNNIPAKELQKILLAIKEARVDSIQFRPYADDECRVSIGSYAYMTYRNADNVVVKPKFALLTDSLMKELMRSDITSAKFRRLVTEHSQAYDTPKQSDR